MANSTDPFAQTVHGTNPQFLIEKITRLKIYNCMYWKEQCFGLTAETIIDKAIALKYCGGTYGGNIKPTNFLCLVLKLLQLQPEKEIVIEFIQNEDFKYLRALGVFYMRLIGKAVDVYNYLEPLYNDYRKLIIRSTNGWKVIHMDEFVDALLNDEIVCDVALPHLPKRMKLEDLSLLSARESVLDMEIDLENEEDSGNESLDEETQKRLEAQLSKSNYAERNHSEVSRSGTAVNTSKLPDQNLELASFAKAGDDSECSRYERKRSSDSSDRVNRSSELPESSHTYANSRPADVEMYEHIVTDEKISSAKAANKLVFKSVFKKNNTPVPKHEEAEVQKFEEGSVEYWNAKREALGLKKLRV